MKTNLLIVEDDMVLGRVLRDNFTYEGFDVVWVTEGRTAVEIVRNTSPNLILLDLGLPDIDGLQLMPLLRRGGPTPVIALTARGQKADKVFGLQSGADDYVTKPFDMDELVARVQALLRRTHPGTGCLHIGDLAIDFATRTAQRGEKSLHFTDKEFEILRYLSQHENRIVPRDELLKAVWGYLETPLTRSVDHAIARLRKKIEPDIHNPCYIHTVHGDGYRFTS
jgi:DNA-binding response OmpR family regulator